MQDALIVTTDQDISHATVGVRRSSVCVTARARCGRGATATAMRSSRRAARKPCSIRFSPSGMLPHSCRSSRRPAPITDWVGRRIWKNGNMSDECGPRPRDPRDPRWYTVIIRRRTRSTPSISARQRSVPVVAQHVATGEMLMLAFADRAALERTLEQRVLWLFRAPSELWGKVRRAATCSGSSRCTRIATAMRSSRVCCPTDRPVTRECELLRCAADARRTRRYDCAACVRQAAELYVTLLDDGNLRLKKLGEEAVELALACDCGEKAARGGSRGPAVSRAGRVSRRRRYAETLCCAARRAARVSAGLIRSR